MLPVNVPHRFHSYTVYAVYAGATKSTLDVVGRHLTEATYWILRSRVGGNSESSVLSLQLFALDLALQGKLLAMRNMVLCNKLCLCQGVVGAVIPPNGVEDVKNGRGQIFAFDVSGYERQLIADESECLGGG